MRCSGGMNGSILGFTKEEINSKFQEILNFSEIGKFIDQPVKTYSSGMFVRLAFSVQAMLEPDILIVDEALSVGDVFFQQKCHKLIENLLESGNTTFLFVTHDMGAIEKYCNDALVLHNGKSLYSGDKKTAILKYYRPDQIITELKKEISNGDENKFLNEYVQIGDPKDVVLEEIYITNEKKGIKTNQISLKENFSITIEFKVFKKIKNPAIDITLKDYRGIPIYSTTSLMLGYRILTDILDQDRIQATFSFNNLINTGKYVVSVGISDWDLPDDPNIVVFNSGDQRFIASFENITELNIIEDHESGRSFNGLVDLKSTFQYQIYKV